MATSSKQVADRLRQQYAGSNDYYRFNVDQGLKDVTLADWDKASKISAHTLNYLQEESFKISKCASTLSESLSHTASARIIAAGSTNQYPEVFDKPRQTHIDKPTPACRIFSVPLDSNKNYVQRPTIEDQLRNIISTYSENEICSRRVALHGLGGAGKTEIVVRFCEQHRDCYSEVFWINGQDYRHLLEGFSAIARLVGCGYGATSEGTAQLAVQWLSDNTGWLLIIDNLDDDSTIKDLGKDFLCAGMKGSIVVTSRSGTVRNTWKSAEVHTMSPEESAQLMENIIGPRVFEDPAVPGLLRDLGYLALAIDQAAAYIVQTSMTVEQYHRLFRAEKARLLAKLPSTPYRNDHPESVLTTWNISFSQIGIQCPQADTLLLLLSLLNHEDIPLTILRSCMNGQKHWAENGSFEDVPQNERWIPESVSTVLGNDIDLIEAVGVLRKFSFVSGSTDTSVYLHPLVQFWASERLRMERTRRTELVVCVIGLVASGFQKQDRLPPLTDRSTISWGLEESTLGLWPWRHYSQLAPHALLCLQYALELKEMSEPLSLLALSLLQVLEYSSLRDFWTNHETSLQLIKHVEKLASCTENEYLRISVTLRWLTRSDICPCRKILRYPDITIDHTELINASSNWNSESISLHQRNALPSFASWRGLCQPCDSSFRGIRSFLVGRSASESARSKILRKCIEARLHDNLGWNRIYRHFGDNSRKPAIYWPRTTDERHHRSQHRETSLSWMASYAATTTDYRSLRLKGECQRDFDFTEGRMVWATFRDLCGETSEECRRSAYYASLAMDASDAWLEVERLLYPLVFDSIKKPVQSWSHERCIVRCVEVMNEQGKHSEARELLKRAHTAYSDTGLTLKAGENSPLIQDEPSGVPGRDIQIFVKSLFGKTVTLKSHTCSTVRSVMDSYIDPDSGLKSSFRFIYGSKQLDECRFLSDYGIQNEATLHVVWRLHGGGRTGAGSFENI